MSRYKVVLSNGVIVKVPRDKARSEYEYISMYGLQAVLQRARRSRGYRSAIAQSDVTIRAIICPGGEYVTQF